MRADVEFLASDAMRGRGSGTPDELIAAEYVASNFKKFGLSPIKKGQYILPVVLPRMKFTSAPQLKFNAGGNEIVWTHGKEMVARSLSSGHIAGKLFHAKEQTDPATVPAGSIVVVDLPNSMNMRDAQKTLRPVLGSKAAAIVIPAFSEFSKYWGQFASELPESEITFPGEPQRERPGILIVKRESLSSLIQAPEGTEVTITGETVSDPLQTRNVVGILKGSDPTLSKQYVMFSAHMDHLGICRKTGDTICNGADDDASGTATVLELARIFSTGQRPKRSVMFVTFGSEELGLIGSHAFAAQPPVPLSDIIADIEFEQTALPEPKTPGGFWMTGYSFSNLGSELDKHGATVNEDPFPGSPFFRQSDNYSLAAKGVVAHTMSGAAEFPDYHQPGDEAQKLDFSFLANSLKHVLPGFEWLVNSDFKPEYKPGKNPAAR